MILVGGENLMDMIQVDNQNDIALFEAVPGGSPYNLAIAAGRQGASVGYVTPISEDSNGFESNSVSRKIHREIP